MPRTPVLFYLEKKDIKRVSTDVVVWLSVRSQGPMFNSKVVGSIPSGVNFFLRIRIFFLNLSKTSLVTH